MNNIILAILAISVVVAFPLIGNVYAQTPVVVPDSVKVTGQNTVEIAFTEPVIPRPGVFTFTVTDNGTTEPEPRQIVSVTGDTKLRLTIAGEPLTSGATGVLEWKSLDVRDPDESDLSSSATANDGQNPTVDSAKIVSANSIQVKFSEPVVVDGAEFTRLTLTTGTGITSPRSVNVTTASAVGDIITLITSGRAMPIDAEGIIDIRNVKDDASPANIMEPLTGVDVTAGQIPTVESVKVTDVRTILVTFSEAVNVDENGGDFTGLIVDGDNVNIISASASDTVVTLTTGSDLSAQARGTIFIGASTFDENGKPTTLVDGAGNVVADTREDVEDGIAPTLLRDDNFVNVSKNTIQVKFSEQVKADKDDFGYIDAVGNTRIISNISPSTGNVITLHISGDGLPSDTASLGRVTVKTGVTDLADNPLESEATDQSVTAGQAPTLESAYHVSYQVDAVDSSLIDDTVIQLTFSDAVSITDKTGITFEYRNDSKEIVSVDANGKVVTIVVNFKIPLTQPGLITITNSNNITNTDTSVKFEGDNKIVEPSQIPSIKSAKVTGANEITLEFSENVTITAETIDVFKLPSGETRDITTVDFSNGSTSSVKLTLDGSELPTDATGTITLEAQYPEDDDPVTEVNESLVPSTLVDNGMNLVNAQSIIKNYPVTDGQPPMVKSAMIISSNLVEVKFSEPVYAGFDNFVNFIVDGDERPRNITNVTGDGTDTIRLTIGGSGLDKDDTAKVNLVATSTGDEPTGLHDKAENLFVDIEQPVTANQIPTVIEAKITKPDTITIEFSIAVDVPSLSAFDNFMVDKDKDGTNEEITLLSYSGSGTNTITLTFRDELKADVNGTIDIGSIIVGSESKEPLVAKTEPVKYGQPPSIEYAEITNYDEIKIKFSDKVSVIDSNITDLKLDSENIDNFQIEGFGTDTITLKLIGTSDEQIADDATGSFDIKEITNSVTQVPLPEAIVDVEIRDAQKPVVKTAKITDNNTMTIEFSEKVTAVDTNFNFIVTGETSARILSDLSGYDTDTIVLKIAEPKLSPDAEGKVNITGVNDLADNEITASDHDVMAGQIPKFLNAVVSSPNTITITFSEPVIASDGDFASLSINDVDRNISDVTGSGTDTIILSISDNDIEVSHTGTVTIYDSITDLVGNKLAETLVDEEINADTPPTIESIEITGFNTITVTFSEPIIVVLDDFTNFEIKNDDSYIARNITSIQGSETNTIILIVSGEAMPVGTSGQIDIAPSKITFTDDNATPNDLIDDTITFQSLIDRNGQTLANFYDDDGVKRAADGNLAIAYENRTVKDGQIDTTVTIMGTISHANGTKIADALVSVGNFNATSDSDGNYIISGLEAGTYDMIVLPPIGDVVNRSVTLTTDDTVDFILGSIPSVVGTITDTDGNGVAGITIRILATSSTVLTTVTDENGMYSFDKIDDGSRVVTIVLPEDGSYELVDTSRYQTITVSEGESAVANYTLRSTVPTVGSVKGLVQNDDGLPLTNATVTISTTPEQFYITPVVGVYAFADIPPGSYTLTITHDDYDTATETVIVVAGEELDQFIRLTKSIVSGTINGLVTDAETGVLLNGVSVALSNSSGQIATTTTDVGRYSFDDVDAGGYFLTFTHSGYADANSLVTVTAGETILSDVQLVPTPSAGVVRGTVTDATTGTGVASATVTLSAVGSPILTTSSGSYSFSNISPGTYQLSVTHSGYQVSTLSITVTAGTSTVTNLQLVPITTGPANGTITGVISSDGNAISGAIVTLSTTQSTSVTNDSGEYAFANVPVGSYTVSVTATGYQDSTATGTVTANETSTTNVELTSSATLSTLQGTVYNDTNGNGKLDPSEFNKVIANVKVSLVSADTGITLESMTNASGMYMFSELVEGSYTVYIEVPVFVYKTVQIDSDNHEVNLGHP